MSQSFKLFLFCWMVVFTERLLFWVWLWQLKNYHFKRFIDHFRTSKGKKLIFNLQNLGLFLLILFVLFIYFIPEQETALLWYSYWFLVLTVFFALLCLKVLYNVVLVRLKIPVFTKKSLFLIFSGIVLEFLIVFFFAAFKESSGFLLLLFFFFSPLIFSLLVLVLQPLTVYQRRIILKKAKEKREKFKKLTVIGITGSYGKTSVKEILSFILSKKFKVLKTKKHVNAEIGIAQAVLNELDETHEVFVCEIGAYEKGKIKEVCEVVNPKIGILTGINEQHMSTFGSQQNIISAKFELVDEVDLAILNKDSRFVKKEVKQRKILCSVKEAGDVFASNVIETKEGVSFDLYSQKGDSVHFDLKMKGKQNIINALLSAACAKELGIGFEQTSSYLKDFEMEEAPLKVKKGDLTVIDASYSANPEGVLADLDYLNLFEGKKAIVMPCLIELGKSSKKVHFKIGEKIAEVCSLGVLTTKERLKDVKKSGANVVFLEKADDILELLNKNEIKTVLLESRVPKSLKDKLWK